MYPHYSYPVRALLGLVCDALLRRPRAFQEDARACVRRLRPELHIQGEKHIPLNGCYAITPNHYYRRGFGSQWSALAISAVVPAGVHWIITSELTFPGHWIAPLGMPVSRFVLGRIAQVYGFSAMPPMPPRPGDAKARAASVRKILRYVRQARNAVIALAPEGGDQPGGRLSMPPRGLGRFCLLLATASLRFLPVGVYESDGALTLNFGSPYELSSTAGAPAGEKDRAAALVVMTHIAALLPVELRGDFCSRKVG